MQDRDIRAIDRKFHAGVEGGLVPSASAAYVKAASIMSIRSLAIAVCSLLLAATVWCARAADDPAEGLAALTELLGSSDDPQFQLDILKGMSEGLKGRRG